ncbi:sodium-dependent nutrient amino acid transporter 1 [Caerostris darwini]|uniref:Sodium-dependent nutrient amino acid transporter 1 n=1 Tax=Caerostris darwini TaxID=1538125 RepID=A0AAV4SHT2_9ARAC|nr:sodium-dependent nutrient amino acid transporter 1 [Caerostris darwini]
MSDKENDIPPRPTWSKSVEGLLMCVSMTIGLGNVWKFPNVAYNNGGGAFLIPYLLILFIIGRPLYDLELMLGQFSSQGPIKVWRIVPAFKGIGYAQLITLSYILIYYNYLMALCTFYFFASMLPCLPWTKCHFPNGTFNANGTTVNGKSPSEYFWITEVLQQSNDAEFLTISWKLALCLLLTWIVVYLSVIGGPSSLGLISYFTAIFPFFGLAILFIIAGFEEGAWVGIKYFFQPDLEKLKDITVWNEATVQAFYSLNVAYGSILMVASYNKFHTSMHRDTMLICVLVMVTNLLAGCVTFAMLGSLAYKYSKDVHEVINHEGLGLAFVVYPEALAAISYVPQLWAVLFFFMLYALGIGSSMGQLETILTVLKDKYPKLRKHILLLSFIACVIFFVLGLPLTTNYGQQILQLLNFDAVNSVVLLYAVLQVVGVAWVYGLRNFCNDVEFMLNRRPGIFFKFAWTCLIPVALVFIFLFGLVDSKSKKDLSVPQWTSDVGWFLAIMALIPIPLWFIIEVYKNPHTGIVKKFVNSLKPADNWGPSDPLYNVEWREQKNAKDDTKTPKNSE